MIPYDTGTVLCPECGKQFECGVYYGGIELCSPSCRNHRAVEDAEREIERLRRREPTDKEA